ncbi:hypothetical protein P8631_10330 [Guyparkeria sp. 1SP6A2]|nr:hypothetical protein [Guyparkeria sp. 1SP6A2]
MNIFRAIVVCLAAVLFSGCAYNSNAPVSASYDVYSSYGDKVPGRYALYIDGGDFKGDFKPLGFACSAHTYSQDATGAFEQSVIKTFENIIVTVEPVDSPLSFEELKSRNLDGQIVVRGEEMDVRISVIPGFWSASIEADVEFAANMTVDSQQGRLLGTTVSGDGDALAGAGTACEGGAKALSLAASDALKELMQRLGERISNSPRVRDAGVVETAVSAH